MENEITLHDIERRLAALEKAVTSLTEKTGRERSDGPRGKFAHIGGIEVLPARSFQGSPSVDLSEAYGETGRCVLPPNAHPMFNAKPEEKDDEAHTD
jgi:hypothetical protein